MWATQKQATIIARASGKDAAGVAVIRIFTGCVSDCSKITKDALRPLCTLHPVL